MKISKLLLAALGATIVLGAFVSTASARNLSISTQFIRTAFTSVRFSEPFGGRTDCAVTLEGSLHTRTIAKVAGTLIGYITRADLGTCATGTATILRETLPWHVRYLAFAGTLPNITRLIINVIGASFRVRFPGGTECLARTTPEQPGIGSFERDITTRELTSAEIRGTIRTSCFGINGTFTSSRNTPTQLGTTTRITVTLI
jgi:hypothetical protein